MTSGGDGLHPLFNNDDPAREGDIVFVHGLGGSSHDTWRHGLDGTKDHFFWPLELGADLKSFGIWTVGYPAGFIEMGQPGMIIAKRAGNLALKLANAGVGTRPVVFICHSMGGLVVKALVADSDANADDERKRLAQMVRGIVFCGTPHRGSEFADAAVILGKVLGGAQAHVDEMRANAESLDLLHERFIEWQRKSRVPIDSYAENNGLYRAGILGRLLPLGLVVPRASANTGIAGHSLRDIDADHLTLVKPRHRQSDVYAGTLRFIRKYVEQPDGVASSGGADRHAQPTTQQTSDPKPEPPGPAPSSEQADLMGTSVPPDFADLMPRQKLVDDLEAATRQSPLVVVGGLSGAGKTYAVSEFVGNSSKSSAQRIVWYDAAPGDLLENLLSEVGPILQLKALSTPARCKELCTTLRAKGALLVVDDFQNVEFKSCHPLLQAVMRQPAPAIMLLITQRDAIVSGNVGRVVAKKFSRSEACKYLDHRRVLGMSELMIDSFMTITSGLPFAASLFCTLVTEYGEAPLELLSRSLHTDDSVTAWFDRIMRQVSGSSLQLIQLLSLIGAPFNSGLVKLVAEVGKVAQPELALRELQRVFLVQRYSPYRLHTHDLVASRCREMVSADVRDQVYMALSRFFLRGYPRRSPSELLGAEEFRWKTRALEQLLRADVVPSQAMRLYLALVPTAKASGRYAFVIDMGETIKKVLSQHDPWVDYHIAHSCLICGHVERARLVMDELFRRDSLDNPSLALACRRVHAETIATLGRLDEAHALLKGALDDSWTAKASTTTRAQAVSQLAVMDLGLGRHDEARKTGEALLAEAAKSGNRRGAAVALSVLGGVALRLDDFRTAIAHLEQATQLFADCNDRRGLVWASAQVAECLVRLNDEEAAARYLLDAAHTAADIGECSADYLALLERVYRFAVNASIRSTIEIERSRVADWELARG